MPSPKGLIQSNSTNTDLLIDQLIVTQHHSPLTAYIQAYTPTQSVCAIICVRPNRQHYGSCPSGPRSVPLGLVVLKKVKKNKIVVNVPQGRCNRCANFQLQSSKVKALDIRASISRGVHAGGARTGRPHSSHTSPTAHWAQCTGLMRPRTAAYMSAKACRHLYLYRNKKRTHLPGRNCLCMQRGTDMRL